MRKRELISIFLAAALFPVFLLGVILSSYLYEKYKKGLGWSEFIDLNWLTDFKRELTRGLKEFLLQMSKPNKLDAPVWENLLIWFFLWMLLFFLIV